MKRVVILTMVATLAIVSVEAQTRRPSRKARSRDQTRLNPRVLNRELAAHLLRSLVDDRHPEVHDGFELVPLEIPPDSIRKTLAGYRIAEMAGWITIEVEGKMTVFRLTPLGRRAFYEIKHPDVLKATDESFEFRMQRKASERKITGISFINANEAVVEWVWVWEPTDLVKGVLRPFEEQCSARFALYDDGWRISILGTCR